MVELPRYNKDAVLPHQSSHCPVDVPLFISRTSRVDDGQDLLTDSRDLFLTTTTTQFDDPVGPAPKHLEQVLRITEKQAMNFEWPKSAFMCHGE